VSVLAVTTRERGDRVVLEAASRADEHGGELHVLYVLDLGWFARLELGLAERVGVPVGTEVIEGVCARIADVAARDLVDEYEAVGRVGDPVQEAARYADRIGARCVVVDGTSAPWSDRSVLEEGVNGIPVVPVY